MIEGVAKILALFKEVVEKALLSDEEIGNAINLETEYTFPCSDGSSVSTFDARPAVQAQIQAILKLLGEE